MIRKHRDRGTIEFELDRDGAEIPHLMGSWNGWQRPGIPMVREPDETRTWKTEVELPPGEHQFRYRIGDDWFNDSSADRTVENGMGGKNSVVVVEETPGGAGHRSSPTRPRRDVW